MKAKTLVVEDHSDFHDTLIYYLQHMGFEVINAESGIEGIKKAYNENLELIILDVRLRDLSGTDLISLLTQ